MRLLDLCDHMQSIEATGLPRSLLDGPVSEAVRYFQVHEATIERNAYPSPLNYYNFPKSVCTSVNEVICHGIPDLRELEVRQAAVLSSPAAGFQSKIFVQNVQEGDIVNVDVSAYYGGYHGDLNETFVVGKVDEESKNLIKVTYEVWG